MKAKSMNGEEISQALQITRQAVSNSLKRGMNKCYAYVRHTWPDLSPLSSIIFIMRWLDDIGTLHFDENEIKKFINLFPAAVRQEVEVDIETKRGTSYRSILERVNYIYDQAGR
jgi:hypothetical protein